jgi:hypothetical protein
MVQQEVRMADGDQRNEMDTTLLTRRAVSLQPEPRAVAYRRPGERFWASGSCKSFTEYNKEVRERVSALSGVRKPLSIGMLRRSGATVSVFW